MSSRNFEIAEKVRENLLTLREIGELYGITGEWVRVIAKEYGVVREQGGEAARAMIANRKAAGMITQGGNQKGTRRPASPENVRAAELVDMGMTYLQAAKYLGVTRSAVSGAVYRARRAHTDSRSRG